MLTCSSENRISFGPSSLGLWDPYLVTAFDPGVTPALLPASFRDPAQLTLYGAGVRALALHVMENPRITYPWPSVSTIPPHPRLCIWCIQPTSDRIVLQDLLPKKDPSVSGPVQVKALLFKGQL